MNGPRKPKNPSRVFLAKFFGRPWREVERELKRRLPIETTGTEVIKVEPASEPDAKEGSEP